MLILTGCSSNVKPLEIKVSPVKQVNLQLPDVNKITLDPIDWYIVNKDNVEDVFKELEKKKYDEVIIGLNDKGYESLSVNMSKILALVKQQELIIGAYKKYHGEQKEAIKKHNTNQEEQQKAREKENGMSAKRAKKDQNPSSTILSDKVDSSPTGDSKGLKKVLVCQICPPGQSATYNTDQHCRGHMAEAHFQSWILAQYPAKGSKCGFPDCSVTLHSAADRAKHLGLRHKQVHLALQSHLLVTNAKKEALNRFQANEQSANPKARDQKELVKPLRSGSLSEVLGSLQPQKSSSPQVAVHSKDKDGVKSIESNILEQTSDPIITLSGSSKWGSDKSCKFCGGWLKVMMFCIIAISKYNLSKQKW